MGSRAVEVIRGTVPADLALSGFGGYGSDGVLAVACAAIPQTHRNDARVLALWKSDADGSPANGGSSTVAYPGLIERTAGPLVLCNDGVLHASLKPGKWKGERLWIVALGGEVIGNAEKLGALEREIICEVTFGSVPPAGNET